LKRESKKANRKDGTNLFQKSIMIFVLVAQDLTKRERYEVHLLPIRNKV